MSFICLSVLIAKLIQLKPVSENITQTASQTDVIKNDDPADDTEQHEFLKGVWVPYMELDVSKSNDTQQAFKEKFQDIINTALEHNINTLIVHVRSHSDALYPSKIFPISHILTGTQGQKQDFDALAYMTETAHANNLKFHAWINPLRISSLTTPTEICDSNPCKNEIFTDKLIRHRNGVIYDPAYSEVRDLVANGVREIVENYNVDAIHFDDYFYPEIQDVISGDTSRLSENPETQRQKNINALIKQVHETIKSTNPNVEFGISPPGNINKCPYMGIDVAAWLSQNYVDYICPQIYWSLDFAECPFEKCVNDWKETISKSQSNAKFYVGLALYKVCTDADNGTWQNDKKILAKELELARSNSSNDVILYSANCFQKLKDSEELTYLDDTLKNQ